MKSKLHSAAAALIIAGCAVDQSPHNTPNAKNAMVHIQQSTKTNKKFIDIYLGKNPGKRPPLWAIVVGLRKIIKKQKEFEELLEAI